jgi:hypothetical protein
MARQKQWIKDLLAKRAAVERAIGLPLGEQLGCGHFGCVFRSREPWVVKLSIDPTEGPIWQVIINLAEQEDYGAAGFARILDVVRLRPDVTYGGRRRRLYAVIHEDTPPVYQGSSPLLSSHSLERLGLPADASEQDFARAIAAGSWYENLAGALQQRYGYGLQPAEAAELRSGELAVTIGALLQYRSLELRARPVARSDRFSWLERPTYTRQELVPLLERVCDRMRGEIGEPLGESLRMLLSNRVVLRDLHLGNVGWRKHARIGQDVKPRCLVIFDPGHTPTAERLPMAERLVANGRWLG